MRDIEKKHNWLTTPLESLYEFVIGGDWGKDPEQNLGEDYNEVVCIRGSEIKNWNKEKGKSASIRKIKNSSLEKRMLQLGDILVEISGGGPDQPVGRTVYIDNETLSIRQHLPKICSNFLRMVRLIDLIDKKYISHYLQHFYLTGEIVNYQGGSNNLRNLKFKEYSRILIPIAPFEEQQRISQKLDNIFHHLEILSIKLERVPELIKAFKEKVLTQAVTGKLTENWRKVNGVKKEWEHLRLDDLITTIEAGKNFKCPSIPVTHDTVGLVKISAVTWGKFDASETKTVTNPLFIIPKLYIKEGDFLFSRANTLELVGASVIVEKLNYRIMLSDKIWRVKFKSDITKKYINHFFKSKLGRIEIESRASGNQLSMRNISQEKFKDIRIALPSQEEQQEIITRIEELFITVDKIDTHYKLLSTKINTLPTNSLAKAFKGELVKKDKKDGSTEILLQKILKHKATN